MTQLFVVPAPSSAQISPGPLSSAHAALEGNRSCLSCHRAGKGVDPALCLDCHGALESRIAAGAGLHSGPLFAACERCHSEHNGREFELVFWEGGRESFDHSRTGHELAGRHAGLACSDCHRPDRLAPALRRREGAVNPDRTFLGLSSSCVSCHEDPHEGTMRGPGGAAASCADCHSQASWRGAQGFDHAATRFPLEGSHSRVACADCHRPEQKAADSGVEVKALAFGQFSGQALPGCASCHSDPHQGRLGADCASCHSTTTFRATDRSGFDHDRTAFDLRGRHRAVACAECHRPGRPLRIPGFERCESCHRDPHLGQLRSAQIGSACTSCHSVEGFEPAQFGLEQHARVGFAVEGAHRAIPCIACHREVTASDLPVPFRRASVERTRQFRFVATACESCHRDPHEGTLDGLAGADGCVTCHGVASWRDARFDHATTRFPLGGAHVAVDCASCHPGGADPARRIFSGRPLDCAGCHEDPHRGQFAIAGTTSCATCHDDRSFRPASGFDHQSDSRFRLDGAHVAVPCASCHPSEPAAAGTGGGFASAPFVRFKPLPIDCSGCHRPAKAGTSQEDPGFGLLPAHRVDDSAEAAS